MLVYQMIICSLLINTEHFFNISSFFLTDSAIVECDKLKSNKTSNGTLIHKELDDKLFVYSSELPIRVNVSSNWNNGNSAASSDSAVVNLTNILEQDISIRFVNVTVTVLQQDNVLHENTCKWHRFYQALYK